MAGKRWQESELILIVLFAAWVEGRSIQSG